MEDGTIDNNQITASNYSLEREPWKGRLNNSNDFWGPSSGTSTPWIQVAFTSAVTITAIQTQGAGIFAQWVKELEIQTGYFIDALSYVMDGTEKVSTY